MADFGVTATSLSDPQGAGTSPVAPARETPVNTSMLNVVGEVVDIFNKGLTNQAKLEAEKRKNAVVSQYTGELSKINDALATGQMSAQEANTRTRAINNKFGASYSEYIEDFSKAAKFYTGETEIGEAQKSAQVEQDQWKFDIQQAQQRGYYFPPGMSKDDANKQIIAAKTAIQAEQAFESMVKRNTEARNKTNFDNSLQDREDKENSWKLVSGVASTQVDAAYALVNTLSQGVRSGAITPENASMRLAERFGNIELALAKSAAKNPELASAYRTMFKDLNDVGKKLIDPKTASEDYTSQLNTILAKVKIGMITNDPKFLAAVAANQLLPNNTELALVSSNDAVRAMMKFVGGDVGPYNPIVGNKEIEADALKNFKGWLKTFDNPNHPNPALASAQMATTVNGLLTQTAKFLDSGEADPKKLAPIAAWFASPEYAKYVNSGQINQDASLAAMKTFQMLYEPEVKNAVLTRLQGVVAGLGSDTSHYAPTKILDAVDIRFNGSGVSFEPKKGNFTGVEIRKQADIVKDLNKTAQGLNQLIHIGAHMEGTTNYAKYWEANKHVLLPGVYPPPAEPNQQPAKPAKQQTASAAGSKQWWEE